MITILACFLICSFIFTIMGKSFVWYFEKVNVTPYGLFDSFFIGICIVGTVLNTWSLFLPTDQFSFIFILTLSFFLLWFHKKKFAEVSKSVFSSLKSEKLFTALIVVVLFIAMIYAMITPKHYDTYLYHINSIQWNYLYRAVPGLANLHERFGFNSSVFVLSSGFSFIQFFGQYLFIINSLCCFVFFTWLLKQAWFGEIVIKLISLLYLYFFASQYGWEISSPGTDILPNILVSHVLLSLLFNLDSLKSKSLLYIVLPIFCLTLKLSVLPIVLLAVVAVYIRKKKIFPSIKQIAFYCCILLLPWIIRNIILTGYVLYPMESLDIFNFDWETSKSSTLEIRNWIYSWSRVPMRDYHEVLALTFSEWFPIWWKDVIIQNRIAFILAAISPAFVFIYVWMNKSSKQLYAFILIFIITYSSTILWLFTAPGFRFSYSFMLVAAFLPLILLKDFSVRSKSIFNPLLAITLVFTLFVVGRNGYQFFIEEYPITLVSKYMYKPRDISHLKTSRNVGYIKRTYFTPDKKPAIFYAPVLEHTQTFDKFPATWYFTDFELRGEDLQDGFRFYKNGNE